MKFLEFLKRLFVPCEHTFVFVETIEEQNLRGGYPHKSRIYQCTKCPKRGVREDMT